jgi:ankyrin repeat protein
MVTRRLSMADAAANGQEAIAHLLVEHGAQVDARTDDGKTPYDLASERGHRQVAEWLKAQTADR